MLNILKESNSFHRHNTLQYIWLMLHIISACHSSHKESSQQPRIYMSEPVYTRNCHHF